MPSEPKIKISLSSAVGDLLSLQSSLLALACLAALVLANSLFAYSNPSPIVKIGFIFIGIVLPLVTLFLLPFPPKKPLYSEALPMIPPWGWAGLFLLAVFVRFFHLTTLSSWPTADEGMFGYFAIQSEEHWDWSILHGPRSTTVLYSWILGFLFRIFGSSLVTLWFLPALLSLACVPAAGWACRKIFPRSISFITYCGIAFSFWPVYIGRFSTQCVLMILWEYLALGALADYLHSSQKHVQSRKLYLLALITGTGFYTYTAWPLVAAVIGLTLLFYPGPKPRERFMLILKFAGIVLLPLIPFLLAFSQNYHGYFRHLWTLGSTQSFTQRIQLPLGYLTDFFWGGRHSTFHFGPLWGGLLNSVSTSLFFTGLIFLIRSYRQPAGLWTLGTLVIFFIPALLTNNLETMRLCQLQPLFLLVCAFGIQFLLLYLPLSKRLLILVLILGGSFALDGYHLFLAYPRHQAERFDYYDGNKSLEYQKAYPLIKAQAILEGPGLILLNSNPDPYDQSLFTATYGWNAAENPRLNPAQAKWAALLTNIHEQPYLRKAFPDGKWVWLSEGLGRSDGGFLLEMITLSPQNRELVNRWVQADQSLRELTRLVMELGVDPDQTLMRKVLNQAYPFFQGDPLLESRYWRLAAVHVCAEGKTDEAVADENKAVQLGCPMAHLYNEMGCLLFQEKKIAESKEAFQKALGSRPNCTNAAENLKNLEAAGRP